MTRVWVPALPRLINAAAVKRKLKTYKDPLNDYTPIEEAARLTGLAEPYLFNRIVRTKSYLGFMIQNPKPNQHTYQVYIHPTSVLKVLAVRSIQKLKRVIKEPIFI